MEFGRIIQVMYNWYGCNNKSDKYIKLHKGVE